MKNLINLFALVIFLIPAVGFSQQVTNVSSEVKDNKVVVKYTLSGKFYQTFNVSLYISRDGGQTFEGPLKEVTGAAGPDITKGTHTITWNVFKEMPFVTETIVFDVRAEITGKKPKKSFFISYIGNTTTYIGLRGGMLGMVGFYVEVRGNLDAFKSAGYTYKDSIVDYDQPGYFTFTEKNGYSAWSALAGITYQPTKNLFLYLGVGYGKEEYLLGINEYSYDGDVQTGSGYVKYDGYCNSGIEVDLGVMYKIKWLLLSAGGTVLNFKSFNWTAGIGVAF